MFLTRLPISVGVSCINHNLLSTLGPEDSNPDLFGIPGVKYLLCDVGVHI